LEDPSARSIGSRGRSSQGKEKLTRPMGEPFPFSRGRENPRFMEPSTNDKKQRIYIFKNTKSILRLKVESNKIRID